MSVCPQGHQTTATDYCDVCGALLTAAPEQPAAAAADASATTGPCPNCGTENPADALFCENCGFDYTTGTLPRTAASPSAASDPDDDATGLMPVVSEAAPTPSPAPEPSTAPRLQQPWVVEVWIDPDWYAAQGSADPMPSPGLPVVVRLQHTSNLIGRASVSRGISPEVDLASDTGVSRRHAQLTTDGSRWFVEDLGSSNGTYVGDASGSLPEQPIPTGPKRELGDDDRIYLGAWSRLVVREATEGEFG